MKTSELRAKNDADLQKELLDLRKAQFGLRMQVATQQLKMCIRDRPRTVTTRTLIARATPTTSRT